MKGQSQFDIEVERCVDALKKGGLVLYPTDTVWGIGCDACRQDAVGKIFALKKRDDAKALITLVDSVEMLDRYVDDVPEVAYQLIEVADKPLTIVYDRGINVSPNLLADDGSIGIRVTTDPFCKAVIRKLRRPLVSTSANISGDPSPSSFKEISSEIENGVDYVVNLRHGDAAGHSVPSTVIKLGNGGVFKILRK